MSTERALVYLITDQKVKQPYIDMMNRELEAAGHVVYETIFAGEESMTKAQRAINRTAMLEADALVAVLGDYTNEEIALILGDSVKAEIPTAILQVDGFARSWITDRAPNSDLIRVSDVGAAEIKLTVKWLEPRIADGRGADEPDSSGYRRLVFEAMDKEAVLPTRSHLNDAGFDLTVTTSATFDPGQTRTLGTSLKVQLAANEWALLVGRSSTLLKNGLLIYPGVVDADYRGELRIVAHNTWHERITVLPGQRLAQLILMANQNWARNPVFGVVNEAARGLNGFGSTGA